MTYFLFDYPISLSPPSVVKLLNSLPCHSYGSPRTNNRLVGWLKGVRQMLRVSSRNDIIICGFDFQAILLWWICLLTLRKRKIICINILLKTKVTLKNRLVASLYHYALKNKNIRATVTSKEYGNYIQRKLGLKNKIMVLHDRFIPIEPIENVEVKYDAFCGGSNGRNWSLLFDVAKRMPNISFRAVMTEKDWLQYRASIPSNVYVLHNVSFRKFLLEMQQCRLVTLPINTEAPAGLMVVFQAASLHKPVIITDTISTREYLSDSRGYLVSNDAAEWVRTILHCLNNSKEGEKSSLKLLNFLERECSEEHFVQRLQSIIDHM